MKAGRAKSHPVAHKKRQIKKARTEIRQLAELVDLTSCSNDSGDTNANPMGGRNGRHQQRQDQANNVNQDVAARISELKAALNLSPVKTLSIKQTNIKPQQQQNWESLPGTMGSNECDTNADCGVAGKNMIPLKYTMRSADVSGFSSELGIIMQCRQFDYPYLAEHAEANLSGGG